jgi:short-subunit dehydrogenase
MNKRLTMRNAIIVTATHGLGITMHHVARDYLIACKTYSVKRQGVGESKGFFLEETNFTVDISDTTIDDIDEQFDFIVWNTGVFLHKLLTETTDFEIDTMIDLHYRTPLKILRNLHRKQQKPYHLIAVSSCSSWRMRELEAVYCGLCAAKATFIRNFAKELENKLPGSKTTLINPGGVRTPFFYEEEYPNLEGYLNQEEMAAFIWKVALKQKKTFEEIQYLRNKNLVDGSGAPIVEYGVRCAETI